MKVIAVIGDIVASKQLGRREVFQRRLTTALARIGKKETGLASPYTVTLGDEFQAVYRSATAVWTDLTDVMIAIHPVRARFALGVGQLTTRLNPDTALGMDGPAFHRARDTLTALKASGRIFAVGGGDEATWALANSTLALVSHYLADWELNRLKIFRALLQGRKVRELESELRISRVAIYKNINAAALDEVVRICQAISRALDEAPATA